MTCVSVSVSGFRVRGSGCGVQSLGLGVWGETVGRTSARNQSSPRNGSLRRHTRFESLRNAFSWTRFGTRGQQSGTCRQQSGVRGQTWFGRLGCGNRLGSGDEERRLGKGLQGRETPVSGDRVWSLQFWSLGFGVWGEG